MIKKVLLTYLFAISLFSINFFPKNSNLWENTFSVNGDITIFSQLSLKDKKRLKHSFSTDLEISANLNRNFSLFIHFENGKGKGFQNINDMISANVNEDILDTNFNVKITELYLEKIFSNNLTISAGKLDPTNYLDQNKFANDETTQFFTTPFKYNISIDMPDNAMGMDLEKKITKNIYINTLLISEERYKNHRFEGKFISTQVKVNIKKFNFRTFVWKNSMKKTGFGMNLDGEFENFGIFFRTGKNSGKKEGIKKVISFGTNLKGKMWKREKDEIGLGIFLGFPDRYGKSCEKISEIYYKIKVWNNLFLSFNSQLILNSLYPDNNRKNFFFMGIRTFIFF